MKSHDDTTQRVRVPMLRPRVIEQHDDTQLREEIELLKRLLRD